MGKKFGIDLGTSYSCACYVDDNGGWKAVDSSDGGTLTPSVVFFDPNGKEVVVGACARIEGAMDPACMVAGAREYLGDPSCVLNVNGREYSPTAVCSLILQKLILDAQLAVDDDIDGAVITCPAYFGEAAREAIRRAAEDVILPGGGNLRVLSLLAEPVAAALAYAVTRQENIQKQILVYDLGGSTFDCAVLKIDCVGDAKSVQIITIEGNPHLGGKDWDDRLAAYVRNEFCARTGCDPEEMREDPENRAWAAENIERAKIALANKNATKLVVCFDGWKEKIEITREAFERETEDLLDQTVSLVNDMLNRKGLNMDRDIDEILLVGGSTKMPQVRKKLEQAYSKPIVLYEPDKAVAMGAAWVAANHYDSSIWPEPLPPEPEELMGLPFFLPDLCAKSYGLPALRGNEEVVSNMIRKDTELPAAVTRRFVTAVPDQRRLCLEIYENNSPEFEVPMAECAKAFEPCYVELTPGLPQGAPIDITFCLDEYGKITLTALDVTNNTSTTILPLPIEY